MSLSKGDTTAIANAQKALTSLSNGDTTAIANAQKALTSLAVPVADILTRFARSDRATTGTK
ncbi:MAG: hypothetical protein V5A43_09960 [Haloarculaceae archaeon]